MSSLKKPAADVEVGWEYRGWKVYSINQKRSPIVPMWLHTDILIESATGVRNIRVVAEDDGSESVKAAITKRIDEVSKG